MRRRDDLGLLKLSQAVSTCLQSQDHGIPSGEPSCLPKLARTSPPDSGQPKTVASLPCPSAPRVHAVRAETLQNCRFSLLVAYGDAVTCGFSRHLIPCPAADSHEWCPLPQERHTPSSAKAIAESAHASPVAPLLLGDAAGLIQSAGDLAGSLVMRTKGVRRAVTKTTRLRLTG